MKKKKRNVEDISYEHMKREYPDVWAMLQRDWRENSKYACYSENTWMEPLKLHGIGNKIKYWDLVFPTMAQHKPKNEEPIKEEASRNDVKATSSDYEWKQIGYTFIKVKKGVV